MQTPAMALQNSRSCFHRIVCRRVGATLLIFVPGLCAGAFSEPSCVNPEDPLCMEGEGQIPNVALLQSRRGGAIEKGSKIDKSLPNILLIFPDDMYIQEMAPANWTDLAPLQPPGDYGNWSASARLPDDYTLNIEKLATEGSAFSAAYTTSSYCAPSRWALLMGRYPSRSSWAELDTRTKFGVGVPTEVQDPLPMTDSEAKYSLPSMLQAYGYKTGMVGKWGLNFENETYSTPYADLQAIVRRKGFEYVEGLYIRNLNLEANFSNLTFSHNMEWVLDRALNFMKEATTEQRPWFLYFATVEPHFPPTVQDAFRYFNESDTPAGNLSEIPQVQEFCTDCLLAEREIVLRKAYTGWSDSGDWSSVRRSMMSAMYLVDSAIGVLYRYLDETGLLDNTYIILTTDHNEAKGTLYEQGIRIPQFVRGPGVQSGVIIKEPVSIIDIAPTILEWVGAAASTSSPLDGISWASLASGSTTSLGTRPIFAEIAFDRAVVIEGSYKYYTQGEGIFENNYTVNGSLDVPAHFPLWKKTMQLYSFLDDPEQKSYTSYNSPKWSQLLTEAQTLLEEHEELTLNSPVGG